MMKIFLIFSLLAPVFGYANDCGLIKVRSMYEKSVSSESITENLIEQLNSCPESKVLDAYMGAAQMILAKHAWNPIRKSSLFFNGKNILEKTILRNFDAIELRFLRLTIQLSIPSFLGYKSSIEIDKQFILSNYLNLNDVDLKTRIKSFIINSGCFTQTDIKYIQL